MTRLRGTKGRRLRRTGAVLVPAALVAVAVLQLAGVNPAGAQVPATTLVSAGTFSISVSPDTALSATTSTPVTITSSNWPTSSGSYEPPIVLECNDDPTQPTYAVVPGDNAPVGCTQINGPTISQTPPTPVSIPFTVQTGTMYASNTDTDTSGGNAGTDSANYPCPPTAAQQAAGVYCDIIVTPLNGLAPGALAVQPLLFSGESAPAVTPAPATGVAGTSVTLAGTAWPVEGTTTGTYQICGIGGTDTDCVAATGTGPTVSTSTGDLTGSLTIPASLTTACSTCFIQVNAAVSISEDDVTGTVDVTSAAAFSVTGAGATTTTTTTPTSTTTTTAPGGGSSGPPTVTEVAPDQGPPGGGSGVVIVGTNLTGATGVNFGTAAATGVTVVSATEVTATAPAGTGPVDVTVTTAQGTSATSSADTFTYTAPAAPTFSSSGTPTITLTEDSGLSATANTPVTLAGTGYSSADSLELSLECNDDPNQPSFNPFASFGVPEAIPIGCNIGDSGDAAIGTMTSGGFTDSSYVIEEGNVGSADSGTDSTGGSAGTDAAAYPCPPTTAQQAAGYVCAVVAAGIGTTANGLGLVDLAAQPLVFSGQVVPTLTTTPPAAAIGQTVTLAGSNWPVTPEAQGATTNAAFQGTISVCSTSTSCVTAQSGSGSVNSSGTLTGSFTVPSGVPSPCPQCFIEMSGSEQITEAGVSATVSGSDTAPFGIIAGSSSPPPSGGPTVVAVSPSSGSTAGGTAVTITGTGFAAGATVNFGTVPATNIVVAGSTTINCVSPAGNGTVDVTVTVSGSTSATSPADQFTYASGSGTSPVGISALEPDFGSSVSGTGVVILGHGFVNATGTGGVTGVSFGSVAAEGFSVLSDTEIVATAPPQADGTIAQVTVTWSGGTVGATGSASEFFYVGTPVVTAVSPASGNASGGQLACTSGTVTGCVTITGSNFNGTLEVAFGGVNAMSFDVVSNAEILVPAPAGTAGTVPVTVTGPAGTSAVTAATGYTYNGIPNPPTVTGITPDYGSQSGLSNGVSITVTISGTNFVSGALVCFGYTSTSLTGVSSFVGQTASEVVVISNSLIAAELPPGPGGRVEVVVKTTGGSSGSSPTVGPCAGTGASSSRDEFYYTAPSGSGYWMVGSDGGVFTFGSNAYYGSTGGLVLNQPVIGMAAVPSVGGAPPAGYWLVATDGGVFTFGSACFLGSAPASGSTTASSSCPASTWQGATVCNITGITPTPDGKGYWMLGKDGGVFTFGDATYYGSLSSIGEGVSTNGCGTNPASYGSPAVQLASTPDGKGYWIVTSDGSVYDFGDADFYGDRSGATGVAPAVGIAPTADGEGYWLASSTGTVYAYGDAASYGSTTSSLLAPVDAIVATADGNGYWLFERNGAVEAFGDAANYGSLCSGTTTSSCLQLVRPIVGASG